MGESVLERIKMESVVHDLLTIYGPLGLGWIIAAYLFIRNASLANKLTELIKENTRDITILAERIDHK